MSRRDRVLALVRERGIRAATLVVGRSVGRRLALAVYERKDELVLRKQLEPATGAHGPGVVLREIGPPDAAILDSFAERYNDPLARRRLLTFLRDGYRGFLALVEGDVAGYFWWIDCDTHPPHPHVVLNRTQLARGDAYGFEYFLAPPFRGSGIATLVLQQVQAALAERGYRRLWGTVLPGNRPARWLYAIAGFEETRSVVIRRLPLSLVFADGRLFLSGRAWGSLRQIFPRARRGGAASGALSSGPGAAR